MRSLDDMRKVFTELAGRVMAGEERTYLCPGCMDEGYTHHERRKRGVLTEVARFCESCAAGVEREAGAWAQVVRTVRGRRPRERDVKAFSERLRAHPRGLELRAAVDALMAKPLDEVV